MSKRWRIHQEALAEIDATASWYDAQRAGLALEFLADLRTALTAVRIAPGVSTRDRAAPTAGNIRRRRLARFPYALVFTESATEYVVIAVMHLRRRPGYWLSRLDE